MGDLIIGTRPLGFPWETVDPFLFCVYHDDLFPQGNDKLGPTGSLAGRSMGSDFSGKEGFSMYHGTVIPGFPKHPHRGFETITVVRHGLCDHSDSLGAAGRFGGGDVQWMTAGRGISHCEMFPLIDQANQNRLELFQIWLNLPRANKMTEPVFKMLWSEQIPRSATEGTTVAIVAGRYPDIDAAPPAPPPKSWASVADNDVAIWTLRMEPGARYTLPRATSGAPRRMLYFFLGKGPVTVGGVLIHKKCGIELNAAMDAAITNDGSDVAEFLMLQGRPINEPVVQHGPFVMSSKAEIMEAFRDYQKTGFGQWPWASDDPAHPRDQGRFALYPDGRREQP